MVQCFIVRANRKKLTRGEPHPPAPKRTRTTTADTEERGGERRREEERGGEDGVAKLTGMVNIAVFAAF
jgi:hypothetical protein